MTYIRKTEDKYIIQGHYGYGWEDVTITDTMQEAKARLKDYRENEPEYNHRMIIRRVKKEA